MLLLAKSKDSLPEFLSISNWSITRDVRIPGILAFCLRSYLKLDTLRIENGAILTVDGSTFSAAS